MGLGIRQQKKQPFAEREKRTLTLRAERIDAKHLIKGKSPKVEAEHGRTVHHPTHEARFFQLKILLCEVVRYVARVGNRKLEIVKVQLNAGDPADPALRSTLRRAEQSDEARLAAIAEDLISSQEPVARSPFFPATDYGLLATNEGGEE